jgi:hypothetical protein
LQHQAGAVEAAAEHYYRRAIIGGKNYESLPLIPVLLAVIGLSAGLTLMEEHNLIFDGVCTCKCQLNIVYFYFNLLMSTLVALIMAVSTYTTSIAPGKS